MRAALAPEMLSGPIGALLMARFNFQIGTRRLSQARPQFSIG
jgi:hypothetical protein